MRALYYWIFDHIWLLQKRKTGKMLNGPVDTIACVISFISIPLYVYMIIILIRHRQHKTLGSAFFTICIFLGVFDLGALILFALFHKFSHRGWFEQFYISHNAILSKICQPLPWYALFGQQCFVLLLSINRFTAITLPLKHKFVTCYIPITFNLRHRYGHDGVYGRVYVLPQQFQCC